MPRSERGRADGSGECREHRVGRAPKVTSLRGSIEVRDETGRKLLTETVAIRTERTQPVMADWH